MICKILRIFCLLTILIGALYGPAQASSDIPLRTGGSTDELLSDEEAFAFFVQLLPNQDLELSWYITPGYYLYADKIQLLNSENQNILADKILPTPLLVTDPIVGDYKVYADTLDIRIPWQEGFFDNSLIVEYQGCKQDGFCFMPINKLLHVNPDMTVTVKNTDLSKFPANPTAANQSMSETDKIAATISNRNLLITMLAFFGFGLLLTFTPCVLPMIPLVINLIVGPKKISSKKALLLSSSYVIGMAGSYAIAGLFVGYLGATLQAWLQQPVVLIVFSLLLFILAFNQFGVLRISLPHFNNRLHKWGAEQLQGSIAGAFILGIISALIVSPCITPPLIGALTYISQDGNAIVGGLTLLSLGLGMGVPLIIVAILSSRILPQASRWMQFIKYLTGIALIGLAIWLLLRVSPINGSELAWQNVNSLQELSETVKSDKYSLVDFYADWCISCKKIDARVFANQDMQKILENYNLIRVDLTEITSANKHMLEALDIYGPPIILFYTPEGTELRAKRLAGEITIDELKAALP